MRDILDQIGKWWDAGEPFGLATVVQTFSSAPREPGAALAVSGDGEVVGSVSGGCVEGAVYELSGEVSASGQAVLKRYGVSDDTAFSVGLTCGGIIDIYVEPVSRESYPEFGELAAAVRDHQPVAVATVIAGPGQVGARRIVWPAEHPAGARGSLGSGDRLDQAVDDDARGMLAQGLTGVRRYGPDGERRLDDLSVFVQSFAPPPRMLVFGAIDFAAAVARIGKFLGYRVTVCDARPVFATSARFPDADEVITDWPHRYLTGISTDERTVICVLTHDPKFDVPVLEVALRQPAAYIGAMGSQADPRRPARPAARGRPVRAGTGQVAVTGRTRPGRTHSRGDGGCDRGRADTAQVGWLWPAAHADQRPDTRRPGPRDCCLVPWLTP